MSKNTPAPVPAGKKPEPETVIEDRDESGKTSAPQSPQGLDNKPKTTTPAPTSGKKHGEDRPM